MKKKYRILLILGIVFLVFVLLLCFAAPMLGIYLIPPTPKSYAQRALSYMDRGLYAEGNEWLAEKNRVMDAVKDAQTYEDTYPALREALAFAGGKHSFLESECAPSAGIPFLLPTAELRDNVLILTLPAFSGTAEEGTQYTQTVLDALQRDDFTAVILDLRGNRGGDLGPMLAAVSPLLPDGTLLEYRERIGSLYVTLEDGTLTNAGTNPKASDRKLPEDLPIAILTDEWTGSSGEAVLLSFRGLSNVITFGGPTAGYASSNFVFRLFDGASLGVTTGQDVARTGEVFCEDPIFPDVPTDTPLEDAMRSLCPVLVEAE